MELDARGLSCPLPLLKARQALAGLAPGVAAGLAAGMVTVGVLRDGVEPTALAGAHRVVRTLTPGAVLSSA